MQLLIQQTTFWNRCWYWGDMCFQNKHMWRTTCNINLEHAQCTLENACAHEVFYASALSIRLVTCPKWLCVTDVVALCMWLLCVCVILGVLCLCPDDVYMWCVSWPVWRVWCVCVPRHVYEGVSKCYQQFLANGRHDCLALLIWFDLHAGLCVGVSVLAVCVRVVLMRLIGG